MNATTKTALVIAFAIVVVLLFLFGGGAMTGATLSGGMMGNGAMGGISWMWIPTLLMLGLGVSSFGHLWPEEVTDLCDWCVKQRDVLDMEPL